MRHWDKLNKKQKKHIRELAGVAYERGGGIGVNPCHRLYWVWTGSAPPKRLSRFERC
jgi:hypothetical protein